MANENNLIPLTERGKEEAKAIRRKGQAAQKQRQREKKTIQKILNDYLQTDIANDPQFTEIANKLGIQGDKSIKEVFTIICMLNTVKAGNLMDLERLGKLLGEDVSREENNGILDKLAEYLKNE